MPDDPAKLVQTVARQIARLRRERGWTQETLAERADVSPRYVQLIEAGEENLTIVTLAKMGAALRVPVSELFKSPHARQAKGTRPRRKKPARRK